MHNYYYYNLMDRSQPIPLCFLVGISTQNRNGVFISVYLSWMEAPAGALGSESRVKISVSPGSPYQASVLYHTVETERICVILSFFPNLNFLESKLKDCVLWNWQRTKYYSMSYYCYTCYFVFVMPQLLSAPCNLQSAWKLTYFSCSY